MVAVVRSPWGLRGRLVGFGVRCMVGRLSSMRDLREKVGCPRADRIKRVSGLTTPKPEPSTQPETLNPEEAPPPRGPSARFYGAPLQLVVCAPKGPCLEESPPVDGVCLS